MRAIKMIYAPRRGHSTSTTLFVPIRHIPNRELFILAFIGGEIGSRSLFRFLSARKGFCSVSLRWWLIFKISTYYFVEVAVLWRLFRCWTLYRNFGDIIISRAIFFECSFSILHFLMVFSFSAFFLLSIYLLVEPSFKLVDVNCNRTAEEISNHDYPTKNGYKIFKELNLW